MRDLDREAADLSRELALLEDAYLARAAKRVEAGQPTMLQYNGKIKGQAVEAEVKMDVESTGAATSEAEKLQVSSAGAEAAPSASGGGTLPPSSTSPAASAPPPPPACPPAATAARPPPPRPAFVLEGETYTAADDPEGAKLLADIAQLRHKLAERSTEKTAIAHNLCSVLAKVTRKLDTDLAFFETDLRSCGDFDHIAGALPGSEVAFRPALNGEDLLLGRVILYHADIGMYDIADVDDSQRYQVPENQVTVLDLIDSSRKLSKGEAVYAVYPDTTAFYLATVSAATRRGALGAEPALTVQFAGDDADLTGQVPHKTVPLKYVIRAG